MHAGLDIQPGELYLFPQRSRSSVYEYHGAAADDESLIFITKPGSSTLRLRPEQFEHLRNVPNGAIRIRSSDSELSDSFVHTDPTTFLDPNAPGLTKRQRERILALKEDRLWALTVQFFTMKLDDEPSVSLSEDGLNRFIANYSQEAECLGLKPLISPSTLRRAIKERGTRGDRALRYFLKGDQERGPYWDPFILSLKAELIDEFWSTKAPPLRDVQNNFRDKLRAKNEELARLGADRLVQPTKETMRLWIKDAECSPRYAVRYGKRAAGRRFRGQQRAIQASRPLEYVMLDHTRVDEWAIVEDEDGKTLTHERPWLMLAVDVFSRVVLAAVLTFAPPSIYTVALCLKQLIRPKDFLPPNLRNFKNFSDFFGKPSFVIVDRAWENTQVSFQTICESVGIYIMWAPVRTPEFKCHVEHAFHDLNLIYWHRQPGGIPHKPHVMAQLGLDPRKHANRNIRQMNDGLWYANRKMAFRVNSGLGMAPARAWSEGFRNVHRPTIDDVSVFDTFVGKVRQCQLTTSGVKLKNLRFHDPAITSALLNDLLRYAKASKQRRAPNSSGTVHVQVTMDPETCEFVYVWNPRTKTNVKLPNVLPRYSAGVSWEEDKASREYAKAENLAFCTEDEMLDVSAALMATYKAQAKEKPFREARKAARKYRPRPQPGPRPQLIRGTIIEEVWEEPSATGMAAKSIPHSLPAREREDERKVIKSTRRGGAAATKKAARTKAKNQEKRRLHESPPPSPPPHPRLVAGGIGATWETDSESAARLKRLAERLEETS